MDILTILRQRDRQSFTWLYDRYAGMLFGMILRMVENRVIAESVLQDTFVQAWKSLDEFDKERGDLFIWMLRMARSMANGYASHRGENDQQTRKSDKGIRTPSLYLATGKKQHSNY